MFFCFLTYVFAASVQNSVVHNSLICGSSSLPPLLPILYFDLLRPCFYFLKICIHKWRLVWSSCGTCISRPEFLELVIFSDLGSCSACYRKSNCLPTLESREQEPGFCLENIFRKGDCGFYIPALKCFYQDWAIRITL